MKPLFVERTACENLLFFSMNYLLDLKASILLKSVWLTRQNPGFIQPNHPCSVPPCLFTCLCEHDRLWSTMVSSSLYRVITTHILFSGCWEHELSVKGKGLFLKQDDQIVAITKMQEMITSCQLYSSIHPSHWPFFIYKKKNQTPLFERQEDGII